MTITTDGKIYKATQVTPHGVCMASATTRMYAVVKLLTKLYVKA